MHLWIYLLHKLSNVNNHQGMFLVINVITEKLFTALLKGASLLTTTLQICNILLGLNHIGKLLIFQ